MYMPTQSYPVFCTLQCFHLYAVTLIRFLRKVKSTTLCFWDWHGSGPEFAPSGLPACGILLSILQKSTLMEKLTKPTSGQMFHHSFSSWPNANCTRIPNDFKPVVTTYENFDVLGFPQDHPGRSKSDTYYLNGEHLLRTHTSAHEQQCFQSCKTPGYLITADVYR